MSRPISAARQYPIGRAHDEIRRSAARTGTGRLVPMVILRQCGWYRDAPHDDPSLARCRSRTSALATSAKRAARKFTSDGSEGTPAAAESKHERADCRRWPRATEGGYDRYRGSPPRRHNAGPDRSSNITAVQPPRSPAPARQLATDPQTTRQIFEGPGHHHIVARGGQGQRRRRIPDEASQWALSTTSTRDGRAAIMPHLDRGTMGRSDWRDGEIDEPGPIGAGRKVADRYRPAARPRPRSASRPA